MGLEKAYDSKTIAKLWAATQRKIAVIVGTDTQLDTQDDTKFDSVKPDVVAQRYRIRVLGEDPASKPESRLPVAYPLQISSGLGGQDMGTIKYVPNTFVYVSKDPNNGTYLIERVVPNYISEPLRDLEGDSTGEQAYSGFIPGVSIVPQTYYDRISSYNLNTAELFGATAPSHDDIKIDFDTQLPKFPKPKSCEKVNVSGVNDAVEKLIKEVEAIKTGITGDDSFLVTAQQFAGDVRAGISTFNIASGIGIGEKEFDISLNNAAGDISRIIAAMMQQVRKWVLRKITTVVNNLIGNVPLSARYLANEASDKALSAISCLFYRILSGLEDIVANILRTIINKILNAADCLVENIFGGIIGNIIGNIIGAINSILSTFTELLGTAIDFANDLLEFVIDLLDFFKCPVKNECPQTEKWDFLSGSSAPKETLDFNSIFTQAQNLVRDVSQGVGNITTTFEKTYDEVGNEINEIVNFTNSDGSKFDPFDNFNAGIIWQSVIDGSCNAGAIDCGPPTVQFWGGGGTGASGNVVVNALGEILGVNIITPGSGYSNPPLLQFQDACGKGKGGRGIAIIGPITGGTGIDGDGPFGDIGTGDDSTGVFDDGTGVGPTTTVGPTGGVNTGVGDDGDVFLDDDTTYDIVDDRGTITIADDLKDFITVTRYNEIEARTETTRNVTSVTFTTTPLYRYYNPTNGDHFTGLDSIAPEGYDNEGILANVFVGPQPPGTIRLIDDEEGNRSNEGKPLSNYTAYVFPRNANRPFKIDGGEIPTTLLYAKTNNRDVLFTSDVNEGSPEYFLDRTNNAYGFAFYAPTSPVSITVTDEEIINTVVYDGTGTEGHLVGSIGYYIDIRNIEEPKFAVRGVTSRLRASGLVASDRSIRLSSAYPQSNSINRYKVAFDMTNSLKPGRQATYVRGFNISLGVEDTGTPGTTTGVVGVVMLDSGYGYDSLPIGDRGGSGRIWANRCQTTVHRANFDWDIPYSEGQTITLFYGDTITLPGKNPVVIDQNFTEDLIPGCVVTGINPMLKDMTQFDYSYGKVYETGIKHQFGFAVDAQRAFDQGFTEQDIRFFLENKFFLRVGPEMREKLLDPNWGNISEFSVTVTAPGCPPGPGTGTGIGSGDSVITVLDDVFIANPGFGYDDSDTLDPPVGDLVIRDGRIIDVNVTNPGIGYTVLPNLKINTRTGFNADLKPLLGFVDANNSGFAVPFGTPTLQVIDCVGKV